MEKTLRDMFDRFGHLPGIQIELHKELIAIRVDNQAAMAEIFLQGAQIASFKPHHVEQPLLWLSDQCDYKAGSPLRGGIPICWPWFGELEKNPEEIQRQFKESDALPAHGLVRDKLWDLDDITILDDSHTRVSLSLAIDANTFTCWPFSCRLQLEVTIGKTLEIDFSVSNDGDTAFCFSGALHSYFAVSDSSQIVVAGLDGVPYIDSLQSWQSFQQQGELEIDQEVDRIYQQVPETITIKDLGYNRALRIKQHNAPSAVVWNPWVDKSKRLSQFANDDYQSMLCVESAWLLENSVTLAPSQRYSSRITIVADQFHS